MSLVRQAVVQRQHRRCLFNRQLPCLEDVQSIFCFFAFLNSTESCIIVVVSMLSYCIQIQQTAFSHTLKNTCNACCIFISVYLCVQPLNTKICLHNLWGPFMYLFPRNIKHWGLRNMLKTEDRGSARIFSSIIGTDFHLQI